MNNHIVCICGVIEGNWHYSSNVLTISSSKLIISGTFSLEMEIRDIISISDEPFQDQTVKLLIQYDQKGCIQELTLRLLGQKEKKKVIEFLKAHGVSCNCR